MNSYESMTSGKWTLYNNPLSSSAAMLVLGVIIMFLGKNSNPALPWEVCGVTILFFSIYNQVMGLFVRRWPLYMGLSYLAFIAHMALALIIAGHIADAPLAELPKFKKTYAVLGVFYIMLTMLAGVYRVALYLISTTTRPS
ncbi:hypothetical protein BH09BAC1_BH09BAC1_14190 [soil metagenome]